MKKLSLFSFAVVCSIALSAQQQPFTLSYNHNALSVKDVDRAAAFYKNVLQLTEITNRSKMDGIRWFSLGEGKELHLVSVIKEPVTINKAVHFALNTNNMEALVKNLTENKVAYSDWPGKPNTVTIRADGVKQIYLQDPDGYWIEINDVSAASAAMKESKLAGTWKLVEFANLDSLTGQWMYPYGKNPRGYFTYTRSGIVNLNISTDSPLKLSADSAKQFRINYYDLIDHQSLGYFGTYTVDWQKSVVTHHVKGGSLPWYIDTDQPRPFVLNGDTLTITNHKTWKRVLVKVD